MPSRFGTASVVALLLCAQGKEVSQFIIVHLGNPAFARGSDELLGERALSHCHLIYFLLDGALTDELVQEHVARLADAIGPIGGLVFDCWVPPPVEVNDVVGARQVETDARCLGREHRIRQVVAGLLKLGHPLTAGFDADTSVYDMPSMPEDLAQKLVERSDHFAKLGEDENSFVFFEFVRADLP